MKTFYLNKLSKEEVIALTKRGALSSAKVIDVVKLIYSDIEKRWDDCLRELTWKFDWILLDDFRVSDDELNFTLDKGIKDAIDLAYKNIFSFHSSQKQKIKKVQTMPWVTCFQEERAIENVALYIPWGLAPLFSTALMLWIPAKIAWCKNIILLSPPNKKWEIAKEILYCAKKCWIKNIFKIWGAQAIWAATIWTKTIPKVDKIFGPWNSYVTAAKMYSQGEYGVSIDMPAWPSEVLVIWDQNSKPDFIASDLLSQAEHGPDSQSVLVLVWDKNLNDIKNELSRQLELLTRKEIAKKSLENSFIIVVDSIDKAIEFSNLYAPEHLIINLKNPEKLIKKIQNAWSVFLWKYASESVGDYASWTNHTLPTSWFAKTYSWVSLDSFTKKISFQKLTKGWLLKLAKTVQIMAEREWLDAHKNSITIRLWKK